MGLLRMLVRALFNAPRPPRIRPRYSQASHPDVPTSIVVAPAEICGRCQVVDGDTIIIAGMTIRLAGIDAPELADPYGKNAKWALINLCKGQIVRAVTDGSSTYDRVVATCYLPDGRDLSAEMVSAGLALDWKKFSGGKYRHLEAPDARRRMWRVDAKHKGRLPTSI